MNNQPITFFSGYYAFLSNFYYSPITFRGKIWDTSEHLYQALKTLDAKEAQRILEARTPGMAKRLGRKVTLRTDWEEVKEDIMLRVLRLKFGQNLILIEQLKNTKNRVLIESNSWHDNIWGNCTCFKCKYHEGSNLLGKLLMQIRKEN